MKKKPILKEKKYAHFDRKIKAGKIEAYVKSSQKIQQHAFMPLIHFTRKDVKYTKLAGRREKPRDLCYVSHKDAFVYQWYAHLLNNKYNKRVAKDGTNNCVIAYRNNKPGKCNANFAKEVIDFIRKLGSCYVIIGDYTGFFDNLDHQYLKKVVCDLLDEEKLPADYWAVLKSIMNYSWFELSDLLKLNDLEKHREINKLSTVLPIEVFRAAKHKYLKKNMHNYGIPQGTPISAQLSNIYMLEFDKEINNITTSNKGIYRRYSDDFIIVMPSKIDVNVFWDKVDKAIGDTPRLKLQPQKTKVFYFDNSKITNCNSLLFPELQNTKNELEYLGFAFDGEYVSIREKTLSKFYYRAYHRVDGIRLREFGKIDKKPDYYSLYKNYTHLGKQTKGPNKGNFLTYIDRCISVFGDDEKVNVVRKRHWNKIQNRLKTAL